jgi:hypothetical protein
MVHRMTDSKLEKSIDTLPFGVDDGTLIRPDSCGGYYVSDHPPAPGTWAELRSEHQRSRLWPVLLHSHENARADCWEEGAAGFRRSRRSADNRDRDGAKVLEKHWILSGFPGHLGPEDEADLIAELAPFGPQWPGPAPGSTPLISPDHVADDFAEGLVSGVNTRLGLFMVERGADVPAVVGWNAGDDIGPDDVSAVLRSWEDRFGARLVLIGFNTMVLSIAAPPTTLAAAQHIAAEHFAFCPENIETEEGALTRYAKGLIGAHAWSFWWERDEKDWPELV